MLTRIISGIKYRKERVGLVQKEGKTYVKYIKVPRFKLEKGVEYKAFFSLIAGVIGISALLLGYEVFKFFSER